MADGITWYLQDAQIGSCHIGDVNHKQLNTTIPSAIIIIVIIPIIFALFLNAKIVIVIKRKYNNTNHAVKPICNASTNSDFATALQI